MTCDRYAAGECRVLCEPYCARFDGPEGRPELAYSPEGSAELEQERFRVPTTPLEAPRSPYLRRFTELAGRSLDIPFTLTQEQAAEAYAWVDRLVAEHMRAAESGDGPGDDGPGTPAE